MFSIHQLAAFHPHAPTKRPLPLEGVCPGKACSPLENSALAWESPSGIMLFAYVCHHSKSEILQGGAPWIAKLVQITPITMVFVGDISIVNGIINQLITWGAPPCTNSRLWGLPIARAHRGLLDGRCIRA